MSAVPYKATMSVRVDGQIKSFPMVGSDVAAAAWTFPDASTSNSLGAGAAVITDIIYTTAGTDTSQVDVYVNGIFTGYTLQNGSNLPTAYSRQVQNAPIGIKAGAIVKFLQKA